MIKTTKSLLQLHFLARYAPLKFQKNCAVSFIQSCYRSYKDSPDRESMDITSTEYSKSGTDASSAAQLKASFDPKVTRPEQEKEIAGEGIEGNPLEVSPANPSISQPVEAAREVQQSDNKGQRSKETK